MALYIKIEEGVKEEMSITLMKDTDDGNLLEVSDTNEINLVPYELYAVMLFNIIAHDKDGLNQIVYNRMSDFLDTIPKSAE